MEGKLRDAVALPRGAAASLSSRYAWPMDRNAHAEYARRAREVLGARPRSTRACVHATLTAAALRNEVS
jgi:hypothetical protein